MPMKIVAALALTVALASRAQAEIKTYKLNDVCKFDKEQYCKDIKYSYINKLRECLAKHEKDLLPRCQDNYKIAR
jgi:hypothetical protein